MQPEIKKQEIKNTRIIGTGILFTILFLPSVYFLMDAVVNDFLQEKVKGTFVDQIVIEEIGSHVHYDNKIQFIYNGDTFTTIFKGSNFQMDNFGSRVDLSISDGDPRQVRLYHTSWIFSLVFGIFSFFPGIFLYPELRSNREKLVIRNEEKEQYNTPKNKSMNSEVTISISMTVIAILITWLAVYLINKKLNNPDSSTEWSGLIVVAVIALIFVLLAGSWWFTLFIQSKSIEIDTDFVAVKPDTIIVKQAGVKIYKWKLECRWNDPISGKQITFKSEPFEGTDVYYNRSKIKVSVYPDKAETFYTVDLSFITTNQGSGIKLITEQLLQEADLDYKSNQEKKQIYEKDQELRREDGRGLTVLINRIVLAGTILLIFIALGIGGWFYFRHRAMQNRIQGFTVSTEQLMQSKGWNFSFQPYDRPWDGVIGMLRKQQEAPYPEGFAEIKGNTNGVQWTLEITTKLESNRGYYQSPLDYWLKNSSFSRLTIHSQLYQGDAFLAFIEIPKSFPDSVKSALGQSKAIIEQHYFAQITTEADRDILHGYIYVLFDPYQYKNALHKSNQTHRWGEYFSNTLFLTITNEPDRIQITNQKVKADLLEVGKSEKGGYGILISNDGIMVSTLNASLKPDEIQAMVDLGLLLKTEIEKM